MPKRSEMPKMFPRSLKKGYQGPAVFVLQVWLIGAGYGGFDGMVPDGYYGEVTFRAVILLQQQLNIHPDGVFGPKTRGRVLETYGDIMAIDFDNIKAHLVTGETVYVG